jgi:hypothetical protein
MWEGDSIEPDFKSWICNPTVKDIKALPIIAAWGIWLAQNHALFNNVIPSPIRCALQSLAILSSSSPPGPLFRTATFRKTFIGLSLMEQLRAIPLWEERGNNIYHLLLLFGWTRPSDKNLSELMALKLTLLLAKEKGLNKLHVYGDSQLTINWMTGCLPYRITPYGHFFKR